MNCEQWDRRLRQWLEARWDTETLQEAAPPELTRHATGCARCARKLTAAQLLMDARRLRPQAPPGLDARVLTRLGRAHLPRARARAFRSPTRFLLPAAAGILLAVIAFLVLRAPGVRPAPGGPPSGSVRVLLVLEAPEAREVSVVGDWNAWDPAANPLEDPDGDGLWTVEVHVHSGAELRYQFLIDGKTWIPDPGAPFQVDDGFGGRASVLKI
jgi:hypothetical protein